ncbi:MAG: aminotransferase class IV [Gemmatimonadetes bacterium]|nr:aminotransferase class IV [Gemmatimonadota bacterium]
MNGEYLPIDEAMVSVNDRSFLFADAIYEATPVYAGRPFLLERHLARAANGLRALAIDYDESALAPICAELIERNGLADAEFAVFYCQVTRGAAPRTHAFPAHPVTPTVYAFAKELVRMTPGQWDRGYEAITIPDQRWARADIKTTGLLPNVLAQQAAVDAGVEDAVFIREGMVMEGTHNNVFAVIDGAAVTPPATNHILHGLTRAYVLELAETLGIPAEERSFGRAELLDAEEVFFCGTTTEIRPTVRVDDRTIGAGTPGPVTRRLYEAYKERVARR